MTASKTYRMGEITKLLNLSGDTLRYYEKIGLLNNIERTEGGIRYYTQKNVSQLRFIKRSKVMNFSLKEIHQLLLFRENPQLSKEDVKTLTRSKLQMIELKATEIDILRRELTLMLNLCGCSDDESCPIIENLDQV